MATLTAGKPKLRAELSRERQDTRDLANRLEAATDELAKVKSLFFGRASDKLSAEERQQIRLFDEAEQTVDENQEQIAPAESSSTEVPAHTRREPVRRPPPESLPREEVVVDISDQDKHCKCGHRLVRIGEEVSEHLDVIMPKVTVIRTVRPKYACHHCEGSGD